MKNPDGWQGDLKALSKIIAAIPEVDRPRIEALGDKIMDVLRRANTDGFLNYEIMAAWLSANHCLCESIAAQIGDPQDKVLYVIGHAVQSYLQVLADTDCKRENAGRVH